MYSYVYTVKGTLDSMKNSILVVDDDPDILEALRVLLEDEGFSVETASNGMVLDKLQKPEIPMLIVLDVLLSGADGRELAERLRQKPDTKLIPIVMISANPGAAHDCVKRGANEFLAKPFEINDLLQVIHKYVPPKNHRA